MTENFLKWLAYNAQIDRLFSGLSITAILTVIAGWIIWRSSIKLFKITLKIILGLIAFGLVLAWYMDYWPWR